MISFWTNLCDIKEIEICEQCYSDNDSNCTQASSEICNKLLKPTYKEPLTEQFRRIHKNSKLHQETNPLLLISIPTSPDSTDIFDGLRKSESSVISFKEAYSLVKVIPNYLSNMDRRGKSREKWKFPNQSTLSIVHLQILYNPEIKFENFDSNNDKSGSKFELQSLKFRPHCRPVELGIKQRKTVLISLLT